MMIMWSMTDGESKASASSLGPCCPCSKFMAKCLRPCPCKKELRCSSCFSSVIGRCQNQPPFCPVGHIGCSGASAEADSNPEMDELTVGSEGVSATQATHLDDEDPFLREKFTQAFGAPLINSEGGTDSEIHKVWWHAVALRRNQYSQPDGAIGTRFVHMLSAELEAYTTGRQSSEADFVFISLILQQDKMVWWGCDIRRLLARRMDMWDAGRLQELLHEAERYDKQLTSRHVTMNTEHVERIFNRLMLQGKVRSAVRFLTERSGGGVLGLHAEAHGKSGPLGRFVLDVLEDKHPSQREVV